MACNFVLCPRVPISHLYEVLGKRIICLMPEKFSELKPERAIGRDAGACDGCPMASLGWVITLDHVPFQVLVIYGSANGTRGSDDLGQLSLWLGKKFAKKPTPQGVWGPGFP